MHSKLVSMAAGLSDAELLRRVVVLAGREREAMVERNSRPPRRARRSQASPRRRLRVALHLLHGGAAARRARRLQPNRCRSPESTVPRHPRPAGRRLPEPQHGTVALTPSAARELRDSGKGGPGAQQARGRGAGCATGAAARRGGIGAPASCACADMLFCWPRLERWPRSCLPVSPWRCEVGADMSRAAAADGPPPFPLGDRGGDAGPADAQSCNHHTGAGALPRAVHHRRRDAREAPPSPGSAAPRDPDGYPGVLFDRALTLLLEDVARKKLAAAGRPRLRQSTPDSHSPHPGACEACRVAA